MLFLCRKCRVLYWPSINHPCLVRQNDNNSSEEEENNNNDGNIVPIDPKTFLSYFSV